jgi:hypothetical protein
MTTTDTSNLKQLEQEAYQDTMNDGLVEIFMGMVFLIMSNLYHNTMPIGVIVVFIIFIFPYMIERIRERWTYPRTGYIKVKPDESFDFIPFIIFLASILILAGLIIPLFPQGYDDTDNLYRVMPFLIGMVMFGPGLYLVDRTGQDRYLLFGLGPTVSGLAITVQSVVDEPWSPFRGMQIFSILWGILFLFIGAILFIIFLRKHPLIEEDITDE